MRDGVDLDDDAPLEVAVGVEKLQPTFKLNGSIDVMTQAARTKPVPTLTQAIGWRVADPK